MRNLYGKLGIIYNLIFNDLLLLLMVNGIYSLHHIYPPPVRTRNECFECLI